MTREFLLRVGYIVHFNGHCQFCNLEAENLIHMLALCPLYVSIHYKNFEIYVTISTDPSMMWITNVSTNDPSLIKVYIKIILEMLEVSTKEMLSIA